jgi:hypothetical protein
MSVTHGGKKTRMRNNVRVAYDDAPAHAEKDRLRWGIKE